MRTGSVLLKQVHVSLNAVHTSGGWDSRARTLPSPTHPHTYTPNPGKSLTIFSRGQLVSCPDCYDPQASQHQQGPWRRAPPRSRKTTAKSPHRYFWQGLWPSSCIPGANLPKRLDLRNAEPTPIPDTRSPFSPRPQR